MKLFLKISNLCNHNTSTLRTDRQTDGQTTCHSNTALCVASRGKNRELENRLSFFSIKHTDNKITVIKMIKMAPSLLSAHT